MTDETDFGVPIPGEVRPESEWAKTGIKRFPEPGILDFAAIFGRVAPIVLELGCGNGRHTIQSALARPDFDHFATDILPVVIRYATRRANHRGLHNVRFGVKDAQSFMRLYVKENSIQEVHLYHPQPYHDQRQAHKRLVTPRFLLDVHRALAADGLFVIQTDNPDYWAYITEVIPVFFDLQERHEPWPDAIEGRSRREILSRSRALKIFRGEAIKRASLDPKEALGLAERLPLPQFRSQGPWIDLDRDEV